MLEGKEERGTMSTMVVGGIRYEGKKNRKMYGEKSGVRSGIFEWLMWCWIFLFFEM